MSEQEKFGAILPGSERNPDGNYCEFKLIRRRLRARNVHWFEREINDNSTVFWFFASELSKLPTDSRGTPGKLPQYLPVDGESGHSLSNVTKYLEANAGTDRECPQ